MSIFLHTLYPRAANSKLTLLLFLYFLHYSYIFILLIISANFIFKVNNVFLKDVRFAEMNKSKKCTNVRSYTNEWIMKKIINITTYFIHFHSFSFIFIHFYSFPPIFIYFYKYKNVWIMKMYKIVWKCKFRVCCRGVLTLGRWDAGY